MEKKYVKTPTIFQMEATECGAASLTMILAYFGCHVPLERVRIDAGVSRNGSNAKSLYYAAQKYGLQVKGYSKTVDGLLKLPVPCIIHWNFNHFVVFEGVKGKYAYLNDPAQGRRKLTLEELEDGFTGVCLTFALGPDFQKREKENTGTGMVMKRIISERSALISIFLMGMILVIPGIVYPIFSQVFMDDVLIKGMQDWMLPLLVAMILTLGFSLAFKLVRSRILIKLQAKMSLISAYKFLDLMMSLPVPFFEQRSSGDLSERVKNNNHVNEFITGDLGQTFLDLFVATFYVILMFLYSVPMTLIAIACIAVCLYYGYVASHFLEAPSKKSELDRSKLVGTLYAGLYIRDTLKASGSETGFVSRVLGYNANYASNAQSIGKTSTILNSVPDALVKLTNIIILAVGGITVINGNLTPGRLVAYVELLAGFTAPVISLNKLFQRIQTLKADMGRVEDIERYPKTQTLRKEISESGKVEKLEGNVCFENVSFGYSELEPPVIKDFSFIMHPGSMIALVGPSGCGKSTVGKIISGLNKQWEGTVLFDGKTLDEIDKNSFVSSVSTVSQDIALFSGTIRDNLVLWNPTVSEADIIQAAKDACIHDFITTQPGAYDALITEGGKNLSGGQKQRLEIARALVANPTVFVMDEATSALDPLVEKDIMDNIRRRGCTMVIVAHRLSTIRDCDEIIVMRKGEIIERGTHEELLQQEGIYKDLIKNA